jgi:hypothetical protein
MQDYKKQVKDSVNWAEKASGRIISNIPNLPKGGQKWLAQNIWWIVLVGVILGVVGIISQIKHLVDINTAVNTLGVFGQYIAQRAFSGWWMTVYVITLVLSALVLFIASQSIQPLKKKQAKGWRILFFSLVAGLVAAVVAAVLGLDVANIITSTAIGLIAFLIGAYFLFQVKSFFEPTAKTAKKATKKSSK